MSKTIRLRSLWLCIAGLPLLAGAQTPEALTVSAAVEKTLTSNPELRAFGYELLMQQGRIDSAAARAPLELGATVEDALGSGTYRGADAAETTISIGWVWERGVRSNRIQAARAHHEVLESEGNLKRMDAAAETARRFLTLLTHQQELEELKRSLSLAEETYRTVEARVAAAKAPEVEQARAYAQLARAKLELEHEEHELLTASARLVAMWGRAALDVEQADVFAQGELSTLPTLQTFSQLSARLDGNPQFARLLTTQRLRETEVHLANAQRRLPWELTAGVRRFEGSGDQAIVLGVTVPLADRRQSRGALSTARAQSEQVGAQSEAVGSQIRAELFAAYQEMKHAHTEAAALRDEVLPRMEVALTQARYAYERGRYSYMEWLAAQREVAEVRRALILAYANAHRYRIEIERLTGSVLASASFR